MHQYIAGKLTPEKLINTITAIATPEKIFTLSEITTRYKASNVFTQSKLDWVTIDQINLLILLPSDHKRFQDMKQELENRLFSEMGVLATVMSMGVFNDMLKNGHPFALKIKTMDCMIYDAGTVPFADTNWDGHGKLYRDMKLDLDRNYKQACALLNEARTEMRNNTTPVVAQAMLRAAGYLCATFIQAVTCVWPGTENPSRLLLLCHSFSDRLHLFIPCDARGEIELFQSLKNMTNDTPESELHSVLEYLDILQEFTSRAVSYRNDLKTNQENTY